jgi:FemAB-related protein (PEP-CTERM system-associated)
MIIDTLSIAAQSEWDAYVDRHPGANCYHLRAWKSVAERAYRLRAPHLIARESAGGGVRGVLPLFVVGPRLHRYVTTGLFGAYGPVLADTPAIGEALLDEARRITRRVGASYLTVKALGDEPAAHALQRRDLGVVATMPLAPDPDLQWKGFRDKIRNCIRKAQKSGFEVKSGPDQLAPFYDVLADNMHRLGTPIYGFAVMRELAAALGERVEVVTLWKDGRAVSGAFSLHYKGVLYVPFASSRQAYFKLNPNNLLYWEIIRRGCERGMRVLDFGRSPRDSSGLAFKLGWGATTVAQPYYIDVARGAPPALDRDTPSVQRMAQLWQRVPRTIADTLGPLIHRSFLI